MSVRESWALMPFHFWSVVFFVFGSMVGSLLNVCIHRMPRGESIVTPGSRCPHCSYAIPWYLNIPIFTWLWLRGKCANCGAPISVRYLLVEFLTGATFLACWLVYGDTSPLLVLAFSLLLAGFIVATFIDCEHFIIPDEITLGGIVAGFLCSAAVPELHVTADRAVALRQSFIGIAVGAGLVYAILRMGKFMFGRQRFVLEPDTRIVFTETCIQLPNEEIPYEEKFYRKTDAIEIEAKRVELPDRCYIHKTFVRLTPASLQVGEEVFDPEQVPHMEVLADEIVFPREAMGLGDVKFMGAIGAFLGWKAVIFSLMVSSLIGSLVGVTLILLKKQAWSSRIPYGPYIALAATVWVFGGKQFTEWWLAR
ncbi:MAG: prepilin peptidase [Verrucomicrobia bacterium]|nr:prepilin peptidase [Verrucomicrobiota bacterium]